MISTEQLNPYVGWLVDIIPLHNYKRQYPDGRPRGKNPIHDEWTTKRYKQTGAQYKEWAENANNVGARINDEFIIFDLDPRNYNGQDSEQATAELFGYFEFDELIEDFPVVRTGSGGYHIYCKLPKQTDPINLRVNIDGINGLDIKRKGGYVVAAGSIHPNGNPYEWVSGSDELDILSGEAMLDRFPVIPTMPEQVYEAIYREVRSDLKKEGWGAYTPQQLQHMFLDRLDPSDYSSNDEWFPLLCAAHHATAGEGLDVFLEWSLRDPEYANEQRAIERRWESLMDKDNSYRAATLIMAVKDVGGETRDSKAVLDFGSSNDFEEEEEDIELMDKASKVGRAAGNKATAEFEEQLGLISSDDEEPKAIAFIRCMSENPTDEEIAMAIRLVDNSPSITKVKANSMLLDALKPLGIKKNELAAIRKEILAEQETDISNEISDLCLEEVFNNKKHIIFEPNGTIWVFTKTHWEEINKEYLTKIALNTVQSYVESTGSKLDQETMASKVVSMIITKSSVRRTKLFQLGAPAAIINCLNGEIHINRDGTHRFVPEHSPRSWQKGVLACNYDPSADCPLYRQTVEEIVGNNNDPEAMFDYLMEIMGYMIQPRKDLGSWWLFMGKGGDGKTTLCEILGHILGKAYKPASSKAVCTGRTTDNHFTAGLVGVLSMVVGDFKKGATLDDEKIKEYADNKTIEANPKFGKTFNFVYSAAPIICSNHEPKAPDNSLGFRRRANVVPFKGEFYSRGKYDVNRVPNILEDKNELSGILNLFLEGLRRLRARGKFSPPKECVDATNHWFNDSNTTAKFAAQCLENVGDTSEPHGTGVKYNERIKFSELYENTYIPWLHEQGMDRAIPSKISLRRELEQLGFKLIEGAKNVLYLVDCVVIWESASEDFD